MATQSGALADLKAQIASLSAAVILANEVRPESDPGQARMTKENEKFTTVLDDNLNTPKALEFVLDLAKNNNSQLKHLYKILGFII